jgi:branched-chain amino acid aminotransferase
MLTGKQATTGTQAGQKQAGQRSSPSASASRAAGAAPPGNSIQCYFEGQFVPLAEARIGVMTHSFLYGTACFEGIRAYWNGDQEQLYGLKLLEHYRRLTKSARVMLMDLPGTPEQLVELTVDLIRRNGFREDTYIRPSVYKSTEAIGVRLHNLEHRFLVFALPFGEYIDTTSGIRAQTVSWRRNSDQSIPARSKIVGAYVNSALAKSEAQLNGFDEAIVLTLDGHASEGSAENLFIVRDGRLITPPLTDDILEGITRAALMELARNELSVETVERQIDRTELYVADEVFLCGTGAQISPVIEVDHRAVGTGKVGPLGGRLRDLYFDAVRGRLPAYAHWLTPIY